MKATWSANMSRLTFQSRRALKGSDGLTHIAFRDVEKRVQRIVLDLNAFIGSDRLQTLRQHFRRHRLETKLGTTEEEAK